MPTLSEKLQNAVPELVAEVTLYPAAKLTKRLGWGCLCSVSKASSGSGYDGWPLLKEPLAPGETRRVGFVFLSGEEAATIFRKAGAFYLWEGCFVGEAVVVLENG